MAPRKSTGLASSASSVEQDLVDAFSGLNTGDAYSSEKVQDMGACYRTPPATPASGRQAGADYPPRRSSRISALGFASAPQRAASVSATPPSRRQLATGHDASSVPSKQAPRRASAAPRSSVSSSSSDVESEDSDPMPTPSRAVPPKKASHTPAQPVGNIFQQSISSGPLRPPLVTAQTSPSGTVPRPGPVTRRATAPPGPSSTPTAPPGSKEICRGFTRKNGRCKNGVKQSVALGDIDAAADNDLPRYCWVHIREVLKPEGFACRATGRWLRYSDWIRAHLQEDTQAALRNEMRREPSEHDGQGYIYAYEEQDESPTSNPYVRIKVGKSVNVPKRIGEWSRQCGRRVVLRGVYPTDGASPISPGVAANYFARIERLVLLELADLAKHMAYADPKFPNSHAPPGPNNSTPKKTMCKCGKTHQEIFSFNRLPDSDEQSEGTEYERIVHDVIERWVTFVAEHVKGHLDVSNS